MTVMEEDSDSPKTSSNVVSSRLGLCQVCQSADGRYRCPRCEVVTCSVACVNQHKVGPGGAIGCDGVRNKTKYIPLNQFTELDVISDYQLLESATRCVESSARDKLKNKTQLTEEGKLQPLPHFLMAFRNACYRRGQCRLRFLPPHFDRRRNNTSKFDWKKQTITWKVQLNFVHSRKKVFVRVPETILVYDIVRPYIEECQDKLGEESPFYLYQVEGFGGLDFKLKSEGVQVGRGAVHRRRRRYHNIDISKSLIRNLEGRSLIEHPVILISMKTHRHYFDDDSVSEGEEEESSCKEPVPPRSKPTSETPQEENGVVNDPALKDSYDFYLNYYSEKYGVNQPKQQASKPDTKIAAVTEKPNVKSTAPGPTIESKSGVPKVMVSSGGLGGLVADYSGSDSD